MFIIMSVLAAVIPMFLYMVIIWRMDKYEPEPFKYVLKHFFWGAFGAIIFGVLGSEVLSAHISSYINEESQLSFLQTIFVAPFVEEITKGIFLIRTMRSRMFDNLTDGLVYGGAIGLGFGMTENFLYFIAYGNSLESLIFLVIIRSGFSAVMHCMSTAALGAFISTAKFSSNWKKSILIPLGFVIAMFIHFLWNFSVSFESTFLLGLLLILFIVLTFFIVYRLSLRNEERIITNELNEEIKNNLFPNSYLPILVSTGRFRKGWIDEKKRIPFITAATKLAFRKHEARLLKNKQQDDYESDIREYRLILQNLFNQKIEEAINLEKI